MHIDDHLDSIDGINPQLGAQMPVGGHHRINKRFLAVALSAAGYFMVGGKYGRV